MNRNQPNIGQGVPVPSINRANVRIVPVPAIKHFSARVCCAAQVPNYNADLPPAPRTASVESQGVLFALAVPPPYNMKEITRVATVQPGPLFVVPMMGYNFGIKKDKL